jgi:hypothetical protein
MPLTSTQIQELAVYKDVVQFITTILDKESLISASTRQLDDSNIDSMNDTIANALEAMNAIIDEADSELD